MRSSSLPVFGVLALLVFGGMTASESAAQTPAQGYRWLDADGNVHYTQTPPPEGPQLRAPEDVAKLVDGVLETSGAKRSIGQIPGQVVAQVRQHVSQQLNPVVAGQLVDIVSRAFGGEVIYGRVRTALLRQADPRRLAVLLEFLSSRLARQMTELEMDATSPEGLAGLRAFAERLQTTKPPRARLELVRRLDAVSGSSELSIDAAVAVFRSMAEVIDASEPAEKRLKPGQLDDAIKKTRAALYDATRVATAIQFLYAYRSVSDQELDQYVQFWESDPARWFAQVFRVAFLEAVSASAAVAAREMTEILPRATQARP